jgi:hypothetical protein
MAAHGATASPTPKTNGARGRDPAGATHVSDVQAPDLTLAQELWGHGNLSPLDEIFESQALVTLAMPKTAKVAFVARHLGRRLQRYSKDTGLWIDAFEAEPALSLLHKDKDAKISFKPWDNSPKLLGSGKFTDLIAFQVSALSKELPAIYGLLAKSLKKEGRLFAADFTAAEAGVRAPAPSGPALLQHLKSLAEHKQAIVAAGLRVEKEFDLTQEVVVKIRHGFGASTEKLSEIRQLEQPFKRQMTALYCAQLETWATAARLLETGRITARALLAGKPGA